MSTYKYERYLSRVTRQPWAITPEMFATLIDLMRFRAAGHRLSDEEIQARVGEGRERRPERSQGGIVAVIPIHGVVAHRADAFSASSGGASTEAISRMFRQAMADEDVKSILLDVDSPGGNVEGVPELADLIYQAKGRGTKRVVAHVNALAASAAYWLATQADELVVTPSGQVGSIGVYLLLEDLTAYLEKEGIKINAISAGENKLAGAPWEPLDDETRAHLQGQVDAVYQQFVAAVARGRKTSQANVKATFGQGRVYDAKEALKRGMVDAVETFDETLARLVNKRVSMRSTGTQQASGSGVSNLVVNVEANLDEFDEAVDRLNASLDRTGTRLAEIGEKLSAGITLPLEAVGDVATTAAEEFDAAMAAVTEPHEFNPADPSHCDACFAEADARLQAGLAAQREADMDYIDAGIRIAERL